MGAATAQSPTVHVYVASFNTRSATELCIRSMRELAGYPFRLTVGDAGSSDGSVAVLQSLRQRGWLELEIRKGWGHADWLDHWRAAFDTDLALFVDSDVEFRRSRWLARMVQAATGSGAALVCAEFGRETPRFVEPVGHKTVRFAERPGPWLLLLDVEQSRAIRASFQFHADHHAPVPEGIMAYDVGAMFFRELRERGLPFRVMPRSFRRSYRHVRGLSWRGTVDAGWRRRRMLHALDAHLERLRRDQDPVVAR